MAPPKTMADELVDKAYALQEEYAIHLEVKAANRRSLRDLATQGMLNEDQIAMVDEIYPPRKKTEDGSVEEGE